jgi:hypothetical protein
MNDILKFKWESDFEWEYRMKIHEISLKIVDFLNMANIKNTNEDYKRIYKGISNQLDKLYLINVPENYVDTYNNLVEGVKHYLSGYQIMLDIDLKDKKNSSKIVKAGQFIEIGTCYCKISSFKSIQYMEGH